MKEKYFGKIGRRVISLLLIITMAMPSYNGEMKLSAAAPAFSIGGLNYYVVSDIDKYVSVTSTYYEEMSVINIPKTVTNGTIEYTVTQIGDGAFKNKDSLKTVTIPDGVTTIGVSAFEGCTSLTKVEFADSVKTIDSKAFYNTSIKDLELPSKIETLGYSAFGNCTGITSIFIPKTLKNTKIGGYSEVGPFCGCSNLSNVSYEEGTTEIAARLFANCSGIKTVDIPNTVTKIGEKVFYNCKNIKELTIEYDVETIGVSAFEGCTSLTKVEFADSVKTIDSKAFYNTSIKDLELPTKIETLGYSTFGNCTGITSIFIPKTLNYTKIGGHSEVGPFCGCSNLSNVSYEEGTTEIAARLFANCSGIKTVDIPETVTKIGDSAFYNCDKLSGVVDLPDSVSVIEARAFYNCNKITAITSYGVTSLGSKALYKNENLKTVTLGANINKVDNDTFARGKDLLINVEKYSDSTVKLIDNDYRLNFSSNVDYRNSDGILRKESSDYQIDDSNYSSYVGLTVNYELKEELSDLKLVIKVSSEASINSIKLDGKWLTSDEYSISKDNLITIPVKSISGKCVVYATPNLYSEVNSYALISYQKNYEKISELIGAVSENFLSIRMENLDTISFNKGDKVAYTEINGRCGASSRVKVYVDGELSNEVTSSKSGKYHVDLELPNPDDYKTYEVKIEGQDGAGESKQLIKTVTTIENSPILVEAKLSVNDGNKTFDLLNTDSYQCVSYLPSKKYSFSIKYENRDRIKDVYVISNKSGCNKKIKAEWDEKKQAYITNDYFDNSAYYVPGNISITYTEKIDESDYAMELTDNNEINMSNRVKSYVSDLWKENVSAEVVANSEKGSEVIIELSNGAKVNYKYTNYTLAEYEEKLKDNLEEQSIQTYESGFNKSAVSSIPSKEESSNNIEEVLELLDFEKYTLGDRIIMLHYIMVEDNLKVEVYDPNQPDSPFSEYVIEAIIGEWVETDVGYLYEIFGAEELGGYFTNSYNVLMTNVNYATDMCGLVNAGFNMMMDTSMPAAVRKAKTQQLKTMMEREMVAYAFASLANGLGVLGMYTSGFGVGLMLEAAAIIINCGIVPAIKSGEFDDWITGNVSYGNGFLKWIIDPSGYVYEAVIGNRIEGVTTSLYYKPSLDTEEAMLWDATEYDQQNPTVTDITGQFKWDVPEGYWQVKAEKYGYKTAYSEWLEVPPIHTDVAIEMKNLSSPKIESFLSYETFAILKFDQYVNPDKISNLMIKNAKGNTVDLQIMYYIDETNASGDVYAKEYKIIYKDTTLNVGEKAKIYLSADIANSGGLGLETTTAISDVSEDITIECDDYAYIKLDEEYKFEFTMTGTTMEHLYISIDNDSIATVSSIEKIDENVYSVGITTTTYGKTFLNLSVNNGLFEKRINICGSDETESGIYDRPYKIVDRASEFENASEETYTLTIDDTEITVPEYCIYTLPGKAKYGYYDAVNHQLYKADDTITMNSDITLQSINELSVSTVMSASIVFNNPSALRFSSIAICPNDNFMNDFSVVQCGTLITTGDLMDEMCGDLSKTCSGQYIDVVNKSWTSNDYTFSATIKGITETNYLRKYVARGYAVLKYVDGTEEYIYSPIENTCTRSVYSVCVAMYENTNLFNSLSQDRQDFILNVLDTET